MTVTVDGGTMCEFYVLSYAFIVFINLSKVKKKRVLNYKIQKAVYKTALFQ